MVGVNYVSTAPLQYSRPDSAIITADKQELIESTEIGDNSLKETESCDICLFST